MGLLNRVPVAAGGKGRNVISAGWQVTPCDPIWHVSSRGDVTLRTAIPVIPYTMLYLTFSLLVGWQAEHLAHKIPCQLSLRSLEHMEHGEPVEQPGQLRFTVKTQVLQTCLQQFCALSMAQLAVIHLISPEFWPHQIASKTQLFTQSAVLFSN